MRSKTPVNNKTFHASKLINKYAESYLNKEEENSHLKSIILDLKTTLKCNKDIITTLTSNLNHDEKTKFLLDSYSKEVVLLNNKVESFTVEIQNLKEKLIYSEQVALENIFKEKNNYEKVEHKIFELENVIEKKEAEIYHLKKRNKKLDNYNEMGIGTHPGHEVFVLDPHEALIKLYDELNMFKEIYNNLSNHYNAQKGHIITYERTIEDLQYELNNVTRDLREKDKQLAIRFNNDGKEKNLNNKIIYQLDKNAKSDLKMSSKPNSKNNSINFNTYFNQGYNYKLDTFYKSCLLYLLY